MNHFNLFFLILFLSFSISIRALHMASDAVFVEDFECNPEYDDCNWSPMSIIKAGGQISSFKAASSVEWVGPQKWRAYSGKFSVHLNHFALGAIVSPDIDLSSVINGRPLLLSIAVSAFPSQANIDPSKIIGLKLVDDLNHAVSVRSCRVLVMDVSSNIILLDKTITIDASNFSAPHLDWSTKEFQFLPTAKVKIVILSTSDGMGGVIVDKIMIY